MRGPKHVVTKGAMPVLSPAEARKLLESIDTGAAPSAVRGSAGPRALGDPPITFDYHQQYAQVGPVEHGPGLVHHLDHSERDGVFWLGYRQHLAPTYSRPPAELICE